MPLFKRPDSPFWQYSFGDDVRESTKIRHEGKNKPPQEAREYAQVHDQLNWRRANLGERAAVSFREAADAWLVSDSKARKRDRECLAWLQEHTFDGPKLGPQPVRDVQAFKALELIRKLAVAKGWAHATVDRHMAVVSAVLNHAHVPMGALDGPTTVPLYRTPSEEPRYLTRPEFVALMHELPYHLQLAAAFAVLSMLRMRSMLSLRWSNVDRAQRVAVILRKDMKGQRRTFKFPLSNDALDLLDKLRILNPVGPWVFQWNGNRIDDCNTAAFQAALRRAGIEGANWHTLRHTGATWARQAGATDGVLMDLADWTDIRTVRRYSRHGGIPQHIHAASEAIGGGTLAVLARAEDTAAPSREILGSAASGNSQSPYAATRGVSLQRRQGRESNPLAGRGAGGDRTRDLDVANVALSQLSYRPTDPTSQTSQTSQSRDYLTGSKQAPATDTAHADTQNPHEAGGSVLDQEGESALPVNVLRFQESDASAALRRRLNLKKSKT